LQGARKTPGYHAGVTVGTLDAIWRYPVKSLRGESLPSVEVSTSGLAGDRTAALFVQRGHARAGKPYRGKEHERLHLTSSEDDAMALGAERGVTLERRSGDRFFDTAPISIIVDRWIEELGAMLGRPVEPERFRPNFFVRADPAFHAGEAELTGCDLQLGEVRLRVVKPIVRCVVVTYDPHGGPSDPNVLRLVAQRRNEWMGILCDVVQPATVHTGDVLTAIA
jgi:uncharacterized protein YcbX